MTDIEVMLTQQEGTGPVRNGRYYPYRDTEGIWTIGRGHNLESRGISADIEAMLFHEDLADALDDAQRLFSCYDTLSRPRQLCLISMAFNLGKTRLAKFVRFIGAVHRADWETAAKEILDSDAARNPALARRYQTLAHMMRDNNSTWV